MKLLQPQQPLNLRVAPRHQRRLQTTEYVVATQRFGRVSPANYLFFARHLLARCQEILPGAHATLAQNRLVVDASSMMRDDQEPDLGIAVDTDSSEEAFAQIFMSSSTMTLQVHAPSGHVSPAFATVSWDVQRPRRVFLYAQCELAAALPNVVLDTPSFQFRTELGISRYSKRLDRRAAMLNDLMWATERYGLPIPKRTSLFF